MVLVLVLQSLWRKGSSCSKPTEEEQRTFRIGGSPDHRSVPSASYKGTGRLGAQIRRFWGVESWSSQDEHGI